MTNTYDRIKRLLEQLDNELRNDTYTLSRDSQDMLRVSLQEFSDKTAATYRNATSCL